MTIRVLHTLSLPVDHDDRLVAEAAALRALPGCVEAEAYRAVGGDDRVSVVQLWEDEAAFSAHTAAVAAGERSCLASEEAAADRATTELHRLSRAVPRDGVWTHAERPADSRVHWPSAGAVRILIQSCFADPEAERAGLLANEAETLREPGCVEFTWHHGLEDTRHVLLTELWEDQPLYDRHWNLRGVTGSAGAPRVRAERSFGTGGAEFYRSQPFRLLYGHWVPSDPARWSTTVAWPA